MVSRALLEGTDVYLHQADDRTADPRDQENLAKLHRTFRNYAERIRAKVGDAFQRDIAMLERGIANVERGDIDQWFSFLERSQEAGIKTADEYHIVLNTLLTLYSEKVIGGRFPGNLVQKFTSDQWSFQQKAAFVAKYCKELERRSSAWRETTKEREMLMQNPNVQRITPVQMPTIREFLDADFFLNCTTPKRRELLAAVKAVLKAKENGLTGLQRHIRTHIEQYARGSGRCLHSTKVSLWIERIFRNAKNPDDVDQFMREVFEPYRQNWERVRGYFNDVEERMHEEGVPRGLNPVPLDTFLLWEFPKRESYIKEAKLRLNQQKEWELLSDTKLTHCKLRIRHHLDTKDWEAATMALQEAKTLAPKGDNDLASMESYLKAHRAPVPKKQLQTHPHPRKLWAEVDAILHTLPAPLQELYRPLLEEENPDALFRLMQMIYNRIWVREHGYANDESEFQNAHSDRNKQTTRAYAKEGHSDVLEHNILTGDTATKPAIRLKCRSPQVLYADRMGRPAVLASARAGEHDEMFGYWTTLIPSGVTYQQQDFAVKHLHFPLKSALRKLHAQGYRFSALGPEPKAGRVADEEKELKTAG
jgi:hypothetical protein